MDSRFTGTQFMSKKTAQLQFVSVKCHVYEGDLRSVYMYIMAKVYSRLWPTSPSHYSHCQSPRLVRTPGGAPPSTWRALRAPRAAWVMVTSPRAQTRVAASSYLKPTGHGTCVGNQINVAVMKRLMVWG